MTDTVRDMGKHEHETYLYYKSIGQEDKFFRFRHKMFPRSKHKSEFDIDDTDIKSSSRHDDSFDSDDRASSRRSGSHDSNKSSSRRADTFDRSSSRRTDNSDNRSSSRRTDNSDNRSSSRRTDNSDGYTETRDWHDEVSSEASEDDEDKTESLSEKSRVDVVKTEIFFDDGRPKPSPKEPESEVSEKPITSETGEIKASDSLVGNYVAVLIGETVVYNIYLSFLPVELQTLTFKVDAIFAPPYKFKTIVPLNEAINVTVEMNSDGTTVLTLPVVEDSSTINPNTIVYSFLKPATTVFTSGQEISEKV